MSALQQVREALADLLETLKLHKASVLNSMTKREIGFLMDAMHKGNAALAALDAETEVKAVPTQRQMNEAFYVDVCRAEDRLKEFIVTSRKLIASLPDHWHGEAETELSDLCDETDAVLNPHLHTPYQVEQATKRYGRSALVSPEARS